MKKFEWKYFYRGTCALVLIAVATGLFSFFWIRFVVENNQTGHLTGVGNIGMATLLYAGLFFVIGKNIDAFKIGVTRKAALMASVLLTAFTTDFLETFLSIAITGKVGFYWDFVGEYALLFLIQGIILSLLVILMANCYRKLFPPLQILEVCGDRKDDLLTKVDSLPYKYHIKETIHYKEGLEEIRHRINTVDAVLIGDIPSHEKNQLLKMCVDVDKRVYFVPKIPDVIVRCSEELNLFDTPLFLRRRVGIGFFQSIIKRFCDIVFSLLAFIVFSPIFLIIPIAIKLEDGGPVLFKQKRITYDGKSFMICKFRSMIVDAEKDGKPHPAGEKDPRITRIGRFIRATRFDELPQFWNILKGEMSIVGPRPERIEHVIKYKEQIPEFSFREKVKAGLTGYAQVYGKYNTTSLDKLKLDLMYIMNYSIRLDIQILFETLKIIIRKESTEGFSEERAEEMHG